MNRDLNQYKIDTCDAYEPFGVFVRRVRWHYRWTRASYWERIDRFKRMDEATAFVEQIKNLPKFFD